MALSKQEQLKNLRMERLGKRIKLASSTPEVKATLLADIETLTIQIEALKKELGE